MCTAASYHTSNHYFGRNLDLNLPLHGHVHTLSLPKTYTIAETITITPRNYPLHFRNAEDLQHHHAILGIAQVRDGYPLYYDAVNEKGLGIAGLNFPGNAVYQEETNDQTSIASFELIPWILGNCSDVDEVKQHLKNIRISNTPFSDTIQPAPLHWMIADKTASITVEAVDGGIAVFDNPADVLTNNPPFAMQMFSLNTFMSLSTHQPVNTFSTRLSLTPYSQGMGSLGLPGDYSSPSRFVRAAFSLQNAVSNSSEMGQVSQFFHILGSAAIPHGCVLVDPPEYPYEYTVYSTCYNTEKGILYYTTYENSQITAVDMHAVSLDSTELISYPMLWDTQILRQN